MESLQKIFSGVNTLVFNDQRRKGNELKFAKIFVSK